jgi:hypothetical protein
MLLHRVARRTTSGGQCIITITSTNGNKNAISIFFTRLGAWLSAFVASVNAERWDQSQRWHAFMLRAFPGAFGTVTAPSG